MCKICDFGCSKLVLDGTLITQAGTFPWMAPELIKGEPASASCDVFSFGVVSMKMVISYS